MKRSREGVVVVRGAAGRPEDRAVQGPNSGHVRGGAEEIQWGREAKGGEAGLQTALQKLQRDGEAAAAAARWRGRCLCSAMARGPSAGAATLVFREEPAP